MPVYFYNPFEDDGFEPKTKTNMPYDYAREIAEARDQDHGNLDDLCARALRPPISCHDGFCGALDCSRCHPDNEPPN